METMRHDIESIRTRPLRGLVTIRHCDSIDPGSDVFHTAEGKAVRLSDGVSTAPIQSLPDHVGVCEVVAVGSDVTKVRPGDFCMIDFYEVKEPYVVDGESLFIAPAEAMRCTVEPKTGIVHPLPGYILTKHAPERMSRAVLGREDLVLPPAQTTSGMFGKMIWSQAQQKEHPCLLVTYEEVVEVGRDVQDCGCEPGDLVIVVTDFCMNLRATGGVRYRLGEPKLAILGVIDDAAVARDGRARRAEEWRPGESQQARKLILVS